jgi:hypothetical protein
MILTKTSKNMLNPIRYRKHDIQNIEFRNKSVFVDFYKSGKMTYVFIGKSLLRFEEFKSKNDQDSATKNICRKEKSGFLVKILEHLNDINSTHKNDNLK